MKSDLDARERSARKRWENARSFKSKSRAHAELRFIELERQLLEVSDPSARAAIESRMKVMRACARGASDR